MHKVVDRGLTPFQDIIPLKNPESKIGENRKIKLMRKISRDLHKGYEMSEENAKKCAELLYAAKFDNSGFL